ncbi:MAG: zinc ribbon domain-containing protein [Alphaproteobacteria bacterium]|jgi:hypothetical protein|nr:zinc ribbon domain-containing protein [Alphaproteobacteria bacterium]
MNKGLRLSEKWFQRGLWLIAVVFALFLIGLGGLIVDDLPKVEQSYRLEDFLDQAAAGPLKAEIARIDADTKAKGEALQTARQVVAAAAGDTRQGRQSFDAWVRTRTATGNAGQDAELLERTRQMDALVARQRAAEREVEALDQATSELSRQRLQATSQLNALNVEARTKLGAARRWQEMRVFGIRLAFTLPPLVIAGWLFAKYRKSTYWPFVWGFIFFALFGFFVELVPYLPSYGGYVRYIVGIVVTLVVGRYLIVALQRYLARQREVEAQPDEQRREALDYELAHSRMIKNICPGCERPIDTADATRNFCTHCGICLFDHCQACSARKNAFARYCYSCGTPARPDARATVPPATVSGDTMPPLGSGGSLSNPAPDLTPG